MLKHITIWILSLDKNVYIHWENIRLRAASFCCVGNRMLTLMINPANRAQLSVWNFCL